MKPFDVWLRTGPIADESISERERTLLHIAYLEGAAAAIEDHREAFDRIGEEIGFSRATASRAVHRLPP